MKKKDIEIIKKECYDDMFGRIHEDYDKEWEYITVDEVFIEKLITKTEEHCKYIKDTELSKCKRFWVEQFATKLKEEIEKVVMEYNNAHEEEACGCYTADTCIIATGLSKAIKIINKLLEQKRGKQA